MDLDLTLDGWLSSSSAWDGIINKAKSVTSSEPEKTEGSEENQSDQQDQESIDIFGAPCVEPDWDEDADEVIEVAIYHGGNYSDAQIVRDYAEYTIAESFGDNYRVDVTAVEEAVPSKIRDLDRFIDYLDNERAKDCNLLITETSKLWGGGDAAIVGRLGRYGDLSEDCVRRYGSSDAHKAMSITLHELGHCLGFSHYKDDPAPYTEIYGDDYTTPMGSSYQDTGKWVHEFHPDTLADNELHVQ